MSKNLMKSKLYSLISNRLSGDKYCFCDLAESDFKTLLKEYKRLHICNRRLQNQLIAKVDSWCQHAKEGE